MCGGDVCGGGACEGDLCGGMCVEVMHVKMTCMEGCVWR